MPQTCCSPKPITSNAGPEALLTEAVSPGRFDALLSRACSSSPPPGRALILFSGYLALLFFGVRSANGAFIKLTNSGWPSGLVARDVRRPSLGNGNKLRCVESDGKTLIAPNMV